MYLSKNINQIKDEYKILTELKELYNLKEKYYSVQDIDYLLQRESILKRKLSSYMKLNYSFDEYNSLQVKLKIINATYLNNKSMNSTFNDVNGRSLDREQRISALSDEKSLLTIAGAGSGKTLTVCGKVKYLLDVEKIDPKDILILSYSKKSADDLESKIGSINDTIHVSTFHKLGLDIIKASMNIKPTVEEQFDAIIEEFFREELKHQPKICEILLKYLSLYSQPNTVKEYKNIGEMFEDLKSNDFTTLKDTLSATNDGKKKTFKKELVKSYEELSIANYLFLNGVDYEYEAPYKYDLSSLEKRQYLPDFHIKDTDIYLEHFGVNREFKCPQFSSSDEVEYLEGIKWKRYVHERYKTKLIETYSFNFNEGTIFDDLKTKLEESGIEFKPRSEEETFEILNSIYSGTDYKSFIKLLKSFISLYKARYEDINGFDIIMKKKFANRYEYDRTYMFIFIARNVYTFYKNKVASNHKIDFDDMILKSTNLLEEIDGYKFKYIFVDEFQDISFSRLKLLQVLIKKGNSKLYVVGDDWQAIYRFSGCDVNIFLNFKDYFEYSNQCLIPSTHRNSQELQNIAEAFITSNPNQLPKNINSNKSLKDPIRIVYYNDNKEQMLNFALGDIYKMNPNANVLLLGRNNYDIKYYLGNTLRFKNTSNRWKILSSRYPNFNISYTTVHSSKGLEEDYVIILNAEDKATGFPNKMEDAPILNLVLSPNDNYPYAEERRLWYVALTRTRTFTYIMVNENRQSEFVLEIDDKCLHLNKKTKNPNDTGIKCPVCKTGYLINKGKFNDPYYCCSNYPYCKYSITDALAVKRNARCKWCGDFLVFRKGQHRAFYGCHSYPFCRYHEEYYKGKY